jgi:hypothetical protein
MEDMMDEGGRRVGGEKENQIALKTHFLRTQDYAIKTIIIVFCLN